jgi:serine protease Do
MTGGWLRALLVVATGAVAIPPSARAAAPPDPVAAVVARVMDRVVQIVTVQASPAPKAEPNQESARTASNDGPETGVGSGFIIDPRGFVATNKHVVANAVSVDVVTADGMRYKARIVGMAYGADMALLRFDAPPHLRAVTFGDSNKMHVGDRVVAIGSPYGFQGSVTAGVVSAVNRDIMESPFDDYIQTDAAINHGNSGGPLFNLSGEVVGMNSVLFAPGTAGGSIGLGFSIPSNSLRFVLGRLMARGKIDAGMLPIRTQQITATLRDAIGAPSLEGALVAGLGPDGDKMMDGKIQPGDVILSFNGTKVGDPRDLARKVAAAPIGSDAALEIAGDGERRIAHVKVQAWPEDMPPVTTAATAGRSLGLELVAGDSDGVKVQAVDRDGTAAESGIHMGDVILRVRREPVATADRALALIQAQSTRKHPFAAVLVERDGKQLWIAVGVPE